VRLSFSYWLELKIVLFRLVLASECAIPWCWEKSGSGSTFVAINA